jgi:glyoxylase-like metal-dependent hydrolase (beta-lactamase superfamily II)
MNTESHRFSVGSFACTVVTDGTFPYPPPGFAANVPPERVAEELVAHGRPADVIETPYSCLVVETGVHRVLIDTGMGPLPPGFPDTTGKLHEHLLAAGIDPFGIDTVVLTHGHADHIGGNLDPSGTIAFPKARFVMGRSEWDYWMAEPNLAELQIEDHLKDMLRQWARTYLTPLRDRIDLIDGEIEIVPGITALAAPGHTPGHLALAIASEGAQLLHLVDVALDPFQVDHPDWVAAFDYDPVQVVATRRRLFDRAADDGALVLCYHFPFPGLGRVERAGDGWRWEPVGTS